MTKVRIAVPGWDSYNGYFGPVEFKNGESVRDLTDLEIARIGANIRIESLEDDKQLGVGATIVETMRYSAEVVTPHQTIVEEEAAAKAKEPVVEEVKEPAKVIYTREDLEKIADDEGIKGVRKVAAVFGVKAVQINQLIDEILEAQDKAE